MNLHKIGVVLLALLLAAMAMVPMVNARESNIHPGFRIVWITPR